MINEYIGKTALITGASSGIGKEFTYQLHNIGLNLILLARRGDLLTEIANDLNKLRQDSVKIIISDVADISKLEEFKENIDLIINNAGAGSFGYFEDLKDEVLVNTNILSTMRILKLILPAMKKRKFGGIISISSIAAFQPLPLMSTYAATKAFNYMHTMGLRQELMDFNIQTLVVCPGPTATEFGGVARVPGTLTGVIRDSVEDVVTESINAFNKKQSVVITGMRSKFIALISKFLPANITTYFVKRSLKKAYDLSRAR